MGRQIGTFTLMQLSPSSLSATFCQSCQTRKLLGAVIVGIFGSFGWAQAQPAPEPTTKVQNWQANPGPWGNLRVRQIQLAPPPEALDQIEFLDTRIWSFGELSWDEIYAFLRTTGLTDTQYAELTAPDRSRFGRKWKSNAIETTPELLLSLSPRSRLAIYNRLAIYRGNPTHTLPWVISKSVKIDAAQFSPPLRAALDKLTYERDGRKCLTDANLLETFAADDAEVRRLKRFLITTRSLIVELTRASLSQRDEVLRYWSRNQTKSIADLLQMLADSPDLDGLDIAHLLPRMPQELINQYPDDEVLRISNCFWTAMNFFNPRPDPQFMAYPGEKENASDRTMRVLERDYEVVAPPYQFGDVLGLHASTEIHAEPRLIHAASYIADDIVISKNGIGDFVPIVLMKLDDVMDLYAWPSEIEIRGYRQKSPAFAPVLLPPPTPPFHPRESTAVPGGFLEFQVVQLTAPDPTIESYLDTFSTRQWWIGEDSRGAFIGRILGLEISARARDALFAAEHWRPAKNQNGFFVTPPPEALGQLKVEERSRLYRELARWTDNKSELWPLFFPVDSDWDRFTRAGIPAAFVQRVRELCYTFGDGYGLSDFSVLAHEFPDRAMLRRFLKLQSTISTVLPRLKMTAAKSISETLAHWTSDHQNPFAQPLLEALLESETEEDVELISIMPGTARRLSFNIEPEEVSYDIQKVSFLISANLSSPSHKLVKADELRSWLGANFKRVSPPYRYGDILAFNHPKDPIINYACAFIGADVIFARDPVGLGLWRFMRVKEILGRNPHFDGGSLEGLRYNPVPASIIGSAQEDS